MMQDIPHDLLRGWQVVLIDDEEDSLEVARFILDFYSAEVHTASNGKLGLDLIRQIRPRFIISDISMPIMDGWELIAALQSDPDLSQIPAIALTAHAMVGDRQRAIEAGFYNYLTKPLTAQTFIQDLVKLLAQIPALAPDLSYGR